MTSLAGIELMAPGSEVTFIIVERDRLVELDNKASLAAEALEKLAVAEEGLAAALATIQEAAEQDAKPSDFSDALTRAIQKWAMQSARDREDFLKAWCIKAGVADPTKVMLVERAAEDGQGLESFFQLLDPVVELRRLLEEAPDSAPEEIRELNAALHSAEQRLERTTEEYAQLKQEMREEYWDKGYAEMRRRLNEESAMNTTYTGYWLRRRLIGLFVELEKL